MAEPTWQDGAGPVDEAVATLAPGDQIAARYVVRGLVGRGSGTAVYRVLDLAVNEEIAVKLIADPDGGVERLRREVRLARKVTHPNVCRVFDLIEHSGGALLSMELAPDGTLAARLGTPHGEAELRGVARQILAGLEAAHAAGVIHRDLKPANVLCFPGGRLAIADFGVARPVDAGGGAPQRTGVAGTPAYMAPEQLAGRPATERTDLYALGLILHELAFGRLPFTASGAAPSAEGIAARVDRDVSLPSGAPLAAALDRLLARDPGARPASVAEARALLGIEPRRRRGLWIAGAVAVVAAGAVALSIAPRPAPPPRLRTLTGGDEVFEDPPAPLPDGSAVVVASSRAGTVQLFWIGIDDALSRQLTSEPHGAREPRVADGHLTFLRGRGDGGFDLVRAPLASLSGTIAGAELVRESVGGAQVGGGRVAFVAPRPGLGRPSRLTIEPPGRTLDLAPAELAAMALSADGKRLAVLDGGGVLSLVDGDGPLRPLARGLRAAGGLSWDDGTLLAVRGDDEARTLVAVSPAGGEVAVAQLPRATDPAPLSGGRLVYVDDRVDEDLWLQDGGGMRRLTSLGDEDAVSPVWAADTGSLAYLVVGRGADPELREVAGDDPTRVIARRRVPARVPYVVVSADGARVAYSGGDASSSVLEVVSLTGDTPPIELARVSRPDHLFPTDFGAAAITYVIVDGKSGDSEVWEAPLHGAPPHVLVSPGGGGFRSADAEWIAYARLDGKDHASVFVQRVLEGQLHGEAHPLVWREPILSYRFAPTPPAMIVLTATGLYHLNPLHPGEGTLISPLPPAAVEPDRIAVGPDGRVAVALGLGRQSLVVVENYDALRRAAR